MKLVKVIASVLVFVVAESCLAATASHADITSLLDAFKTQSLKPSPSTLVDEKLLSERYDIALGSFLEPTKLESLDDASLRQLFEITNSVVFYTKLSVHMAQMRTVFEELSARGLARLADYRSLHGAYLQVRDFESARYIDNHYDGDLGQPTPIVAGPFGLPEDVSKWLSVEKDGLRVEVANPRVGRKVVVVANPLCAFAKAAMTTIENDAVLKARFRDALWVAPQDRWLELDAIRSWNAQVKVAKLHLMFDQWKWPLPSTGAIPGFYFLDNGKVVSAVEGWPGPSQKEALMAAFA